MHDFTNTTDFSTFFHFLLVSQFISCYGISHETIHGYHTREKDTTGYSVHQATPCRQSLLGSEPNLPGAMQAMGLAQP